MLGGVQRMKLERIAGVVMPDLVRTNAMEGRKIAGFQQKIDGRRCAARASVRFTLHGECGPKNFGESAPFRMRSELEQANDVVGAEGRHLANILRPRRGAGLFSSETRPSLGEVGEQSARPIHSRRRRR